MRLIDADALEKVVEIKEYDVINRDWGESDGFSAAAVFSMIADQPTVEPVKHGYWIPYNPKRHDTVYEGMFMCCECKLWVGSCTNYCPACGTKNDGVSGE